MKLLGALLAGRAADREGTISPSPVARAVQQ